MTSKDFIEAEAGNNGSIILYREGLFWKAYEKSAYAVCTQIKPLKAIKRRLKSLGGGDVFIGGEGAVVDWAGEARSRTVLEDPQLHGRADQVLVRPLT